MKKNGIKMLAVFLSLVMVILPNISLATEVGGFNDNKVEPHTFTSTEGQHVKVINSRMIEVDGKVHLLSRGPIEGYVKGKLVSLVYDLVESIVVEIVDTSYELYKDSIFYHFNQLSLRDRVLVAWFSIKLVSSIPGAIIDRLEYHDSNGCVLAPSGDNWICPYSI